MKRVIHFLVPLMVLVLPGVPVRSAQTIVSPADAARETVCSEIVQRAWETVDALCDDTGRNEACYGHVLLDAQPQPDVPRFSFDREGEKVDVVALRSLRLSTMDFATGAWGVALMEIQANLPAAATNQNVSLLLFGDVAIENAAPVQTLVDVTPRSASSTLNVRYRPTTNAPIVGTLGPGEVLTANGKIAGGSWVRVDLPDRSMPGWVYAPLLQSVDDVSLDILNDVEPGTTHYGPMQAFYFESGNQDAMCPEAPNSGILIQTPEGVAEVTLLINEVDIQLGSTVYFQAHPDSGMTISTVEGKARVTVNGQTQTAFAGTQVTVPLDNTGKASGPPTPPQPYNLAALGGLPVAHMPVPVEAAEPMTLDEIEAALVQQATADYGDAEQLVDGGVESGDDTSPDTPGQPNPSVGAPPPGLSDYPPGQGGVPPGQGGEPPGQAKKDKD